MSFKFVTCNFGYLNSLIHNIQPNDLDVLLDYWSYSLRTSSWEYHLKLRVFEITYICSYSLKLIGIVLDNMHLCSLFISSSTCINFLVSEVQHRRRWRLEKPAKSKAAFINISISTTLQSTTGPASALSIQFLIT